MTLEFNITVRSGRYDVLAESKITVESSVVARPEYFAQLASDLVLGTIKKGIEKADNETAARLAAPMPIVEEGAA